MRMLTRNGFIYTQLLSDVKFRIVYLKSNLKSSNISPEWKPIEIYYTWFQFDAVSRLTCLTSNFCWMDFLIYGSRIQNQLTESLKHCCQVIKLMITYANSLRWINNSGTASYCYIAFITNPKVIKSPLFQPHLFHISK